MLLCISLLANVLSALSGGGAGLLQLPAILFLGLPFAVALATHKTASVALGLGASIKHLRSGNVHWPFAILMIVAGLPGVVIGAHAILAVDDRLAELLLGALTSGLGIYALVKKQLGQVAKPMHRDIRGLVLGGLGLFTLGFLNGSLSSGSGLFVTIWLVIWFGFDFKHATAYTLVLVGIFWNGTGALALALQSPIKWSWLPMLLCGSFAGGYLGAYLGERFGNPLIKTVFASISILTGLSLIIRNV